MPAFGVEANAGNGVGQWSLPSDPLDFWPAANRHVLGALSVFQANIAIAGDQP